MKKTTLRTKKPRSRLAVLGAAGHGRATLTSAIVRTAAKNKTYEAGQVYEALVGQARDSSQRVQVIADSLREARELLETEHGKGTVFSLWNREDAKKLRG